MWDVIVIGGGPAGSEAAYHLSNNGIRVLLIEKRPMPRYKPCGGVISVRAQRYLGFPLPPDLVNHECRDIRVRFGKKCTQIKSEEPFGILANRRKFDEFLMGRTVQNGVRLINETVLSVSNRGSHVTVHTENQNYAAPLAIIAAGASSRLNRLVRRKDPPRDMIFTISQDFEYQGVADSEAAVFIDYGTVKHGYGWVFNHGSYRSVGIGVISSNRRLALHTMRKFWNKQGFPPERLHPTGCFLPLGGISRELVGLRLILAGDSAGLVDPMSGEGIAFAIRSGQLAAKTAGTALDSGDFSKRNLTPYTAKVAAEFGKEHARALKISRTMHNLPSLLYFLTIDPDILGKYLKVVSGDSTYFQFSRWVLARLPYLLGRNVFRAGDDALFTPV